MSAIWLAYVGANIRIYPTPKITIFRHQSKWRFWCSRFSSSIVRHVVSLRKKHPFLDTKVNGAFVAPNSPVRSSAMLLAYVEANIRIYPTPKITIFIHQSKWRFCCSQFSSSVVRHVVSLRGSKDSYLSNTKKHHFRHQSKWRFWCSHFSSSVIRHVAITDRRN